jgi:hypothetical protein
MRKDVEAIKRLFILLLQRMEATSEDIGQALGVDASVIRRLVPTRRKNSAQGSSRKAGPKKQPRPKR